MAVRSTRFTRTSSSPPGCAHCAHPLLGRAGRFGRPGAAALPTSVVLESELTVTVLLIAGSPSAPSRSAVLLDAVAARLAEREVPVDRLAIRELAAHALLLGEASHPSVQQAVEQVRRADVIVIATPVYLSLIHI